MEGLENTMQAILDMLGQVIASLLAAALMHFGAMMGAEPKDPKADTAAHTQENPAPQTDEAAADEEGAQS